MKIISVFFGCVLALAAVNQVWAADTGNTGSQKAGASEMQVPAEAPAVSSATAEKDAGEASAPAKESGDQETSATVEKPGDQKAASAPIELGNKKASSTKEPLQPGAYDRNGKPMTRKEYKQAYKARMKARTKTTEDRLEAKQSRWKKGAAQ